MKPITMTLASASPPAVLAGAGSSSALSDADRRKLLERSLGGEYVELDIEMRASIEPAKPMPLPASMAGLANANFSRFHSVGITSFIRSFSNKRFLKDHNQRELDAAGGLILESQPEVGDDGSRTFRQRARLVKPWAVQGVLDGTITQFSIGWHPRGELADAVQCSLCRCSLLSPECPHLPGQRVELAGQAEPVIVEALWLSSKVVGVETSAVLYPAVEGTGIDGFAAELAAFKGKGQQMDKIFQALGLSEDASRDDALAAIAELKAQPAPADKGVDAKLAAAVKAGEQVEALLASEQEQHAAVKAELDSLKAKMAAAEAERAAAEVDSLVKSALDSGRIPAKVDDDGKPVESAVERGVRVVAERSGIAAAREYVEALPILHPVGAPAQSDPSRDVEAEAASELSAREKRMCAQLGISEEKYLARKIAEQKEQE